MYVHILIATDGSQLAGKDLEHGLALAREIGARVTILTVSEPFPRYELAEDLPLAGAPPKLDAYHGFRRACHQAAHGILPRARSMADLAGVPAETIHVDHARPVEAIVATAQYQMCELIVMASHGTARGRPTVLRKPDRRDPDARPRPGAGGELKAGQGPTRSASRSPRSQGISTAAPLSLPARRSSSARLAWSSG